MTSVSLSGQFESQRDATRTIALLSLLSLVGMYAVLYTHFQSHAITLQVLLNIPLALVGSVLVVWLTGGTLSVATLVGFVTLFGITTRNSIMMVSHFEHLVEVEGRPWGPATALQGASERLVPILMTAAVTALGLLPLAIGMHQPGQESQCAG